MPIVHFNLFTWTNWSGPPELGSFQVRNWMLWVVQFINCVDDYSVCALLLICRGMTGPLMDVCTVLKALRSLCSSVDVFHALDLPSHWMMAFFQSDLNIDLQSTQEGLKQLQEISVVFPSSAYVIFKVTFTSGAPTNLSWGPQEALRRGWIDLHSRKWTFESL